MLGRIPTRAVKCFTVLAFWAAAMDVAFAQNDRSQPMYVPVQTTPVPPPPLPGTITVSPNAFALPPNAVVVPPNNQSSVGSAPSRLPVNTGSTPSSAIVAPPSNPPAPPAFPVTVPGQTPAAPSAISQDPNAPPPPPVVLDPSAPANPNPPAAVNPAAPAQDPAVCCDPTDPKPSWWKRVPAVRPMPPPGNFPVPPTGCGYYSALDLLLGRQTERPKFPYSPVSPMFNSFYDADFRYLDDPNNTQHDYLDFLHQIHWGDFVFNTGGEYRNRYMQEDNSRLSGATNDYDLQRTRVYGDLWYRDWIRFYAEFISAQTFGQTLVPLVIDQDPADFQNLFVDIKVPGTDDHPAYVRVGRQEMLLGSQRLVSPLDWANTRRTFEGFRAFRQGDKVDVDFFWVRPDIRTAGSAGYMFRDDNQDFAGAWATWKPQKGQFLDLYYLFFDNRNTTVAAGLTRAPCAVNTFGGRYVGSIKQFLWDFEDMVQIGQQTQPIFASATTAGIGWNFKRLPLDPTWWVYYDYASGTNYTPGTATPQGGDFTTFNQLFPFGHYYFGFLDLVGRQNIHDLNTHLFLYPSKFVTVWLQYHHFELDTPTDALFSAGAATLRRSAAGTAGQTVGEEFDILVNLHLGHHSDLLAGYSLMTPDNFIVNTAPTPAAAVMPSLLYVQYSY